MKKAFQITGLVLLVLCLFSAHALAERLGVQGEMRSFRTLRILADIPEAVSGKLEIMQGSAVIRDFEWTSGETLEWDGLAYFGEPLASGDYTLRGTFAGQDRKTWTEETAFHMKSPGTAVLYALPWPECVHADELDTFVVETASSGEGTLILTCEDMQGQEQFRVTRSLTEAFQPGRVRPGQARMEKLEPGEYRFRLWMAGAEAWEKSCTVRVNGTVREKLEPGVTGPVLPETGMSDAEIWAVMQKPSVVVDIGNVSHQNIYSEKQEKSQILGTLHGQSQALEVLETDDAWAGIRACRHEDGAWVEGYVPLRRLKVVEPAGEYGLLVDMTSQTLAVFRSGERLCTVSVSTGLAIPQKLFRETAQGAFLTDEHIGGFAESFFHYEYPIRYDGGNLMHQVGWKKNGGFRDTSEQMALLGTKASHGCIRLPQANPVFSAYRAWTTLPRGTRVLIMDNAPMPEMEKAEEPEEPEEAEEAEETEVPDAGPVWAWEKGSLEIPELEDAEEWIDFDGADALESIPGDREPAQVVLTAGGDVVLGTRENWWRRQDGLARTLEREGLAYPLSGLKDIFLEDDATLVNLECVLKADARWEKTDKLYRFRGLPSYAEALPLSSVEYVCIANNHYIDYGYSGQKATREALESRQVGYFGYGYTSMLECAGYRIGLCGIRETVYLSNPEQMEKDIRALRDAGADVVICMCHWGKEYSATHNETQIRMAQSAAAAGADLILGGHPHVVQGLDIVDGSIVAWSHGNLMFGGTIQLTTFDGLLTRWVLHMTDSGLEKAELVLIPVLTSSAAQNGVNDYHPVIAQGEDARRILEKVQADSTLSIRERMVFRRGEDGFYAENAEVEN